MVTRGNVLKIMQTGTYTNIVLYARHAVANAVMS